MKKVFSLLLVASMLLSAMVITSSAAMVPLDPITNTNTYIPTPVEVHKFTTPPDIDGVITTEEWVGEASVTFGVATAATTGYGPFPHPELSTQVSADNSFWDPYYTTLTEEQAYKMNTQVWFRYDENNLYVAAKVYDVTGPCNKEASDIENIWNGDNIEFTIDPEGPNSGMLSGVIGFDGDPNYDWTTTPFNQEIFNYFRQFDNINNNYRPCWIRDIDKKNDFVFALDFYADEGENDFGYNTQTGVEYYENLAITVDYLDDGTCYINYEVYIPWADIFRSYGSAADAVPGKVFGAVFSVTEAYNMPKKDFWRFYDSCYCWGGGHFGGWAQDAPNAAGGTNAIVLTDTVLTPYQAPVVDDPADDPADDPVEELPPVIEEGGDDIEVDEDQIVEEPSTDDSTGTTTKTFKIPVVSKPDYKTATELSYTFAFDTEKFEFDSIVGLDAADYKLEQNADGSYKLTIVNVEKVKAATTGAKLFEVAVKTKEGVDASATDIKLELKDEFKKVTKPATTVTPSKKPSSPATGDAFVVVAAVAVVALAAFAVATKKRRFN